MTQQNVPQIFSFDNQQVRMVNLNGEPWFVAADVCAVLDIANPRNVVARLDGDEKDVHTVDTLGGKQDVTTINESGLYSLILTSRKPEAKRFKKWVTSEVLPSIRKTGTYGNLPALPQTFAEALRLAADQAEQLQIMAPKAAFFDTVTGSKDAVDIGTVAKVLNMGIGRTTLFKFLRESGILMGNNQPKQEFIDRGYFRVIESTYSKPDGSSHVSFKTVVYQKGIDYIRRKLEGEAKKAA